MTQHTINESYKLDALKTKVKEFQKDLENMYEIRDFSREFFTFLDDIRESGMVNMFQASDLLWSGSDFIERWVYLNAPHLTDNNTDSWDDEEEDGDDFNEHKEAYQRVLDNADDIRQKVIQVALSRPDVNYDKADSMVKRVAGNILSMWMKHFGSSVGRLKSEVDEVARTLSNARRNKKGKLFPKSAIKSNPDRFREYDKLNEHFFFADVDNEIICDNCGHTWEIEEEDPHPHLCHMCAYDQKKEDYDIDAVVDFWTNKE